MEQEPKIESKEQLKNRIVVVEWGSYDDKNLVPLEVPVDFDLQKKLSEFEQELKDKDDKLSIPDYEGKKFIDWLLEHGAREAQSVERFKIDTEF